MRGRRRQGARAAHGSRRSAGRHPIMHALRGRGLLRGIELRQPDGGRFAGGGRRAPSWSRQRPSERGLMIYCCPTPVGNEHMDALLLAPPLIISEQRDRRRRRALDGALAAVEETL